MAFYLLSLFLQTVLIMMKCRVLGITSGSSLFAKERVIQNLMLMRDYFKTIEKSMACHG